MPVSPAQAARRSLVRVLLALAATYGVTLSLTKDSGDAQVITAHRKVVRKVHPDKGGKTADAQRLQSAKDEWDSKKTKSRPGRPKAPNKPRAPRQEQQDCLEMADPEEARKVFRIQAGAVMLTYNGVKDLAQWRRLVSFFHENYRAWGVKHWCATLETTRKGALHAHCMVQFHKAKAVSYTHLPLPTKA